MDQNLVLLIIGVIFVLFIIKNKSKNDNEDDRISNKNANIDDILLDIKNFNPQKDNNLKNGYTEKSIEKQLYKFLISKYQTVTYQYGTEGPKGKSIDIDIANGVAGIELKLASEILKSTSFDRMKGQLITYQEKKYDDSNLILLVFGSKDNSLETIINYDLKLFCDKFGIHFLYITIK